MKKEVVITKPSEDEYGLRVIERPSEFDGIIISNFDEKLETEERCYVKRNEILKLIDVLKEWYR